MATNISRNEPIVVDRLALSRAQHLKSRTSRQQSISDDENDSISDWSQSDLECSPLSDIESASNLNEPIDCDSYRVPFDDVDDSFDEKLPTAEPKIPVNGIRSNDTPLPIINDSTTSTHMSFSSDTDKVKQPEQSLSIADSKPPVQFRKALQTPLLPARRMQTKQVSSRHLTPNSHILSQVTNASYNRKTISPSPSRLYLRRGTTSTSTSANTHSTKESNSSTHSSIQSGNDERPPPTASTTSSQQRPVAASPNFSHSSTNNNVISRIYEVKKLYVDDSDYGRLSDVTAIKNVPGRSRQKWGTIVHPPFPLGYQHSTPEQVSQVVERLTSPVRCRDRHQPAPTPSKRYLSVEETEALINRLTKVKTLRSPDQYWPLPPQTRSVKNLSNRLKENNNWKGVGISA
ncbi:unnamed protein product [Adineta ricciae]|uniref:Uncharacterized protein n=1 Tax=Adineta ricciae TaxID=249248 RepID=A0A814UV88_ADIRI|nr:unnamed protein product [Adineta ricciae]CAF1179281.1 unnamed protein product [Adineta ricciae]